MDLRQIKNLMKEFEDSKIHKLEINDKEFSIKLEKEEVKVVEQVALQPQALAVPSAPVQEHKEEVTTSNYTEVTAPLVGTFYQSPSPDSDAFVKVGSKVNKGDTLFIVEAMKVMNEITAPVSGTIMSIHINDGQMVEFGQVIMEIEE